ncbi:metal-dependent hydrolase [Parasphingopyxis algicola]|uniref:metal-dependent hydrolase n=1 Tax=Parasphingopyxis algicola TaxID=2026624 RepID=UPI0015A19059|nr:metal-dependent hydrolase [Parasphingopyxis algicola]QLC24034.1 metal-dependent hydrolase [Parasphingopyxis algicola]
MDNLTHSLAGAVLGQMGLKKKTGLGMATLIIAANIPDIDALATLLGGHQHLAIRRGITHGPLAVLVLPVLLTGIMIAFDRWQARRGKRPPDRLSLRKGWLLALAYIGTLSHPALDYLNNYGIRLLEPFSDRWVYGDTLFIIDVWVWAALGIALWLSIWRERSGRDDWRLPAIAAFAIVLAYIGANGLISNRAEHLTSQQVAEVRGQPAELVVANNLPITFWARDMHWRGQGEIGSGYFTLFGGEDVVTLNDDTRPDGMAEIDWSTVSADNPDARAYLFWARMPFVERREGRVLLRDQRFTFDGIGDRFTVDVTVPE